MFKIGFLKFKILRINHPKSILDDCKGGNPKVMLINYHIAKDAEGRKSTEDGMGLGSAMWLPDKEATKKSENKLRSRTGRIAMDAARIAACDVHMNASAPWSGARRGTSGP